MIQQFGETIRKILADAAAAQITKALFGSDSNGGSSSSNGWIGIALNAFSSYLGGARALGGPVPSGVPYLVGERGPELFKPSGPGPLIPTGKFNAGRSEAHTYELQQQMRNN